MKNPKKMYKVGTILIWLGVLVWVPYFGLRFMGESPNLWAFLPFHLAGVLSGGRMRSSARKKLGIPKKKRRGYRRVAHWLVIASLLVWLPYYGLKIAGQPVSLNPFLTVHLVGILGGTGLMTIGGAVESIQKRKQGAKHDVRYPTQETNQPG